MFKKTDNYNFSIMGKNHFLKFHSNEGRIKMCLRCLLNDKQKFIESQASQIADLQYEKDKLQDEVKFLKDELKAITSRYICFNALCSLLSSCH